MNNIDFQNDFIERYLDGLLEKPEMDAFSVLLSSDHDFARRFARSAWRESFLVTFQRTVPHADVIVKDKTAIRRPGGMNNHRLFAIAALLFVGTSLCLFLFGRGSQAEDKPVQSPVAVQPAVIDATRPEVASSPSPVVQASRPVDVEAKEIVRPVEQIIGAIESSSGDMRIISLEGVQRSNDGKLRNGDRVLSGSGPVQLRSEGHTAVVRLEASSELEFSRVAGGQRFRLLRGSITAEIEKQPNGSAVHFETAQATAVVIGTRLGFSISSAGTRLDVHEGLVKFQSKSTASEILVSAGQCATVTADGKLVPPQPAPIVSNREILPVWPSASGSVRAYTASDMTWSSAPDDDRPSVHQLRRSATAQAKDASDSGWFSLDMDPQDWRGGTGLQLTVRGTGSGRKWILEIFDGEPAERFIATFIDDHIGWREVYVPFSEFTRRAPEAQRPGVPDDGLGLMHMRGFGLITAEGPFSLDLCRVLVVAR